MDNLVITLFEDVIPKIHQITGRRLGCGYILSACQAFIERSFGKIDSFIVCLIIDNDWHRNQKDSHRVSFCFHNSAVCVCHNSCFHKRKPPFVLFTIYQLQNKYS